MRNFYPELEYYKLAQDAYKVKTDARITELEKKLDAILEYLGAECEYKPAGYCVRKPNKTRQKATEKPTFTGF